MVLVNVSVYLFLCITMDIFTKRSMEMIYRITLKQLYEFVVQGGLEAIDGIEARIGKAKESLDPVNSLG